VSRLKLLDPVGVVIHHAGGHTVLVQSRTKEAIGWLATRSRSGANWACAMCWKAASVGPADQNRLRWASSLAWCCKMCHFEFPGLLYAFAGAVKKFPRFREQLAPKGQIIRGCGGLAAGEPLAFGKGCNAAPRIARLPGLEAWLQAFRGRFSTIFGIAAASFTTARNAHPVDTNSRARNFISEFLL
jgi:hypothetical protein